MGGFKGFFQKLAGGDDFVHKSPHECLFRFDRFSGGNHFEGIGEAHKPGQPLGSPCSRDEADLHLGLSQVNAFGCNTIVADHGGLQTTPKAISIDGGNDRFGAHLYAIQEQGGPECHLKHLISGLHHLELRDIGARNEVFSRPR